MKKLILLIRKVGFFIVEFTTMTNKNKEQNENSLGENRSAVGQINVVQVETIGGVLTGDPVTRAESDFNVEVGNLHQESRKNMKAIEKPEKVEQIHPYESTQTEIKE